MRLSPGGGGCWGAGGFVAGAAALYVLWPLIAQLLRLTRAPAGGSARRHQPPGLANVGNSCYVNCLMQALASCGRFVADLRSLANRRCQLAACLLAILRHLRLEQSEAAQAGEAKEARDGEEEEEEEEEEDGEAAGSAGVQRLLDCLRSRRWVISLAQQDSHEFYSVLMQSLNEELHKAFVDSDLLASSLCDVASDAPTARSPPRSWLNCGLCATDIKCMSCGQQSAVKLEIHHCLTVPLPAAAPPRVSLEFLLQQSFRAELVRDANCDACGGCVTLRKSVKVARAPGTLAVHLQRVAWSSAGCPVKSSLDVAFPKILDLRPVMHASLAPSPSDRGLRPSSKLYRLVAVVLHLGDEESGHFLAFRQHRGQWWRVSDDSVRRVSEAAVLAATNVYMLFYELL